MKQLDAEYTTIRLKTYIAPAVPPLMAAIGIVIGLLWFVQLARGVSHLRELAIATAAIASCLVIIAILVAYTASHGMSTATGLLGVVFVTILSFHYQMMMSLFDMGVELAIPYCILLAVGAVAFWPKHWHMVLGTIGVAAPPIVQIVRTGAADGRVYFYVQLAVVCLAVTFTLYHLIWKANLRMFRLAQEIEYRAYHDTLTGLNNRSRWYEIAKSQHELMSTSLSACSLLYLDIDRFKSINDSFGHDVGDRTLQAVTKMLRQNTREGDVLARFGGEEFVVLLPSIDLPGAIACAQRLHQSLRDIDLLPDGVTISVGVAESLTTESLEELINRADKAMLQAKASGRNRTVIASGEAYSTLTTRTSPPFANAFNGNGNKPVYPPLSSPRPIEQAS